MAYTVTLPPEKARAGRDTLIKCLYAVLVEWLTARLSRALYTARTPEDVAEATLTVVDLPGLECCERNGFHQLLSNYGFERLSAAYAESEAFSLLSSYDDDAIRRPPGWSDVEGGIARQAPALQALKFSKGKRSDRLFGVVTLKVLAGTGRPLASASS